MEMFKELILMILYADASIYCLHVGMNLTGVFMLGLFSFYLWSILTNIVRSTNYGK